MARTSEPMRRAFARRMHQAIDRMADEVDLSTLEEALGLADPFSGLSVAMEHLATQRAGAADPLSGARGRAVGIREELVERAGGVLRLGEAASLLGVTPQAVTGRRQRGTILSVPMPNGEWVYPRCQFTPDGLVSGLSDFLAEFDEVSPWTRLAVLLAASERHDGRSALELLQEGETDAARSIAATYGSQG